MQKISAVIITLNEEKNISRCLEALQKIADEIIVIDSFSSDQTVKICQTFGCSVFQHEFKGYSSQKQAGVSKATYDWVLSIDADEVLSDKLIESILLFKRTTNSPYQGFYVYRNTFYLGKVLKFCGQGKEKILRLFHKNFGGFTEKEIHEEIKIQGRTGKLKGKIIHYTHENITDHIHKLNTYTSYVAEDYIKRNKKYSRFTVSSKFILRFFTVYILKRGILDGYQGYMWSVFSAFYATVKYAKFIELKHHNKE